MLPSSVTRFERHRFFGHDGDGVVVVGIRVDRFGVEHAGRNGWLLGATRALVVEQHEFRLALTADMDTYG